MLQLRLGLVLLAMFSITLGKALTTNPSPKPYDECDEASDEFFYLVQQWPPGYCQAEKCSKSPPQKFTVHGFWPNYCQKHHGKGWPEFCSGEDFNLNGLADLEPTMESEWPSLGGESDAQFWQHEWDKHGTCALSYTPFGLNSQHEYFETILKLHQANDLYTTLAAYGITPGGTYTVEEIQVAMKDALQGDVYLHCQNDNILVEVYVCYNQRLERVPCSRQGVCKENVPVQYVLPSSSSLPLNAR